MVQIIENWSVIRGPIITRAPHPRLPDFDVVTVRIDNVQSVAAFANLMAQFVGQEMQVTVRRDLLKDAAAGAVLSCRAKRTMDGAMCESFPQAGDFSVQPDVVR